MRRCSTSLITREMQSKTTKDVTSHLSEWLSPKWTQITNIGEHVEKRQALFTVDGDVNWCCHCGKHYRGFSKNWKQNHPAIPFLGMYPGKSTTWKVCASSVHSSIIHNCHDMEAIYMPIHSRMDKEDVVYIYWRRKWQPTPVFLPRESWGRRSLVGCHLCGRIELDTTEAT